MVFVRSEESDESAHESEVEKCECRIMCTICDRRARNLYRPMYTCSIQDIFTLMIYNPVTSGSVSQYLEPLFHPRDTSSKMQGIVLQETGTLSSK